MNQLPDPVHFKLRFDQKQAEQFFSATNWNTSLKPLVHPIFATYCREGEFLLLKKMNVELNQVLHGEQKYKFFSELKTDTDYQVTSTLHHHYEKQNSKKKISFFIFLTKICDLNQNVCIEATSSVVKIEIKESKN